MVLMFEPILFPPGGTDVRTHSTDSEQHQSLQGCPEDEFGIWFSLVIFPSVLLRHHLSPFSDEPLYFKEQYFPVVFDETRLSFYIHECSGNEEWSLTQ